MHQNLDRAILRTIIWFDLFDFPLLPSEVGRLLYQSPRHVTLARIFEHLQNSPYLRRHVQETRGFYHLRGRAAIIATRQQRYHTTKRHRSNIRFRLALWLARCVPFVRFIAVGNSAAYGNAKLESDLDLFIVVKDGSLYLTRLWITAVFQLLGIRRHGTNIAGRACLSFYVTEKGAALETMFLPGKDPYFSFWGALLWPLFDAGGLEQVKQSNHWLRNVFPHDLATAPWSQEMVADSWLSQRIRNGLETMLSYPRTHRTLESVCQTVQHWKMKHHPCARSRKPNASIIVSPTVLKFHEDDRRHELRQKFSLHLRRYRCVS